jgi:hypothetical protein
MLKYAAVFLFIALLAGVLGFAALVGIAASLAQILFFVFVALTVVSVLLSVSERRPIR